MDTIAAISTAHAVSAIGIVRLSGSKTKDIIARLFTTLGGRHELTPRRMTYGTLRNAQGEVLDHAMAVYFTAEHSYTGEESAEFHCHGSPVVLGEVLSACFAAGARQAGPGEFTKRAFLNDRLDLTEAEAVIDLIDAESAEAAKNAAAQIGGALRRPMEKIYSDLLDISSRFYAVVDYPDEDIEDLTREQMDQTLCAAEKTLADLLATFARGKVLKSGVATAIIGAPNAGKSSLLNALVGYDRAIVTDIAGTTRDTVEEKAVVGGVLLRLIDTAGIRETDDTVEKIGVERSRKAVEQADLVLALIDGSKGLQEQDKPILALAKRSPHWILVWTKDDLSGKAAKPKLDAAPDATVELSALTHDGFDQLEEAIKTLYPVPKADTSLLTNARQADAVKRALESIRAAKEALDSGMTPDAILTEIEEAQTALGELTGRTAREDMVERIFSRFCVGK